MESKTNVKKWLQKNFQLHGYSLRADAGAFLAENLLPVTETERQQLLTVILSEVEKSNLDTAILDLEQIKSLLDQCTKKESPNELIWNVIHAFDIPLFNYCNEKKRFEKDERKIKPDLFGPVKERAGVFRQRYTLLHQRTLRHDLFKKSLLGTQSTYQLKNIEWFLCSSGRIDNAVVLGLLVKVQEGSFVVEDLTGSLKINISNAKFHDGLFPEHCFILAEGFYEDKVFHVQGLGFPPAELAKKSRPYFGSANTFGGPSDKSLKQSVKLLKIQEEDPDAMIVFISDVWLDNLKVLGKLKVLFSGFSESPPTAFVFMGNFLSTQYGSAHATTLKTGLKSLGEIIESVPSIAQHSHIVLIPGPSDIGSPLILPRPPLPNFIAEDLLKHVPKIQLGTNPCRIQYCTREIVVIREDLISKMRRNTVHHPTGEIPNHFVKTLACQATLAPMSPNVCPLYWSYAHALNLYPLPDLVVIGDQFNRYSIEHMGCTFTNPGSFVKTEFSFDVYVPHSNEIEPSVVPSDA